MKRPSDGEIALNMELVKKLVKKLPAGRRQAVEAMLDGFVGEQFFTAPASSRESFHSCYPGGLCQHSLNVLANLRKLAAALCPGRWDDATLVFVGLFHDLGKVGDGVEPCYVPNPNEWGRKRGFLYEINDACVWMPSSERALYLLQRQGIALSSEELLAIRLNDGQYVRENEPYRMREPALALLVHFADRWAAEQEKAGPSGP